MRYLREIHQRISSFFLCGHNSRIRLDRGTGHILTTALAHSRFTARPYLIQSCRPTDQSDPSKKQSEHLWKP